MERVKVAHIPANGQAAIKLQNVKTTSISHHTQKIK